MSTLRKTGRKANQDKWAIIFNIHVLGWRAMFFMIYWIFSLIFNILQEFQYDLFFFSRILEIQ